MWRVAPGQWEELDKKYRCASLLRNTSQQHLTSLRLGNGFISTLLPQREIYAKNNSINGGHTVTCKLKWKAQSLWALVILKIEKSCSKKKRKKKKNLVPYGWPPKNKLKSSTYVTTETNCEVCCQIKCTVFWGKMYCFGKRTQTDIFLKKTCGQQANERCSTLLNNRQMQIKTMRFHSILGWLVSKNYKITRVGKDAENLLIGMWNGV